MRQILIAIALLSALPFSFSYAKEKPDEPLAAITGAVQAREYDRAVEMAKELAEEQPLRKDLASVLYDAGVSSVKQGRLEAAAGFYRLLVDKFPESEHASAARAELAGCYTALRRLDECIAQAKANLKLEPDSQQAEYWTFLIGQSYFRLWDFARAKTELEAFLARYPNGKYAKNARSCLEKIDPPWKVDEHGLVGYSGKYEGDIRLEAAMKALPADIDAGFRTLKDRLGLDLKPHTNVIYVYADAGSDETQGRLVASTFVVGRDNKPAVVIRFHSEYVVAQPANYRKTIVHEMKHAGFEGLMGHSYDDLPQWIREGLAVWGSKDVDDRLRLVLCNQIIGSKDPLKVLNCIESPDHNEADYLEDALAFDWLESKKPGNVKAFCSRLVKGEPYRGIWADLAGKSYAEAMAEADAYCRRTVETALGEAYPSFRSLYDAHRESLKGGKAATAKWLEGGAKAALEKWIADHPDHPAGPFARFCLARSLITAGQHAEGRELLHWILKEDALRCALLDDAQLWIGVSYVSEKDAVNARAAFGVLLRDFSYSASVRQVAGKYPAAGPVTR